MKCTCGHAIGHPLVPRCTCKGWVGLTDEEIRQACWESGEDGITGDREAAVRAAIAKLKEKNHG